jgi:tetratricopeptide (TPR) repeat protein
MTSRTFFQLPGSLCLTALLFAAHLPARAVEEKPNSVPTIGSASTGLVPMDQEDAYQETVNQAVEEFQAERYDETLALLEQARETYPRDPFVMNLQGAVYTKLKDWDQANRFFNMALNEDPQFFAARFNLGEVLFLQGNREEALAYFESLNQMFQQNELIEFKLVVLFLLTDRVADAERLLGRMQYPGNGPAWYYANAAVNMAKGERREARRYLSAVRGIFDEGNQLAIFDESLTEAGLNP